MVLNELLNEVSATSEYELSIRGLHHYLSLSASSLKRIKQIVDNPSGRGPTRGSCSKSDIVLRRHHTKKSLVFSGVSQWCACLNNEDLCVQHVVNSLFIQKRDSHPHK